MAPWRMQPLTSAHLPHQVRFAHNFATTHVFSVTRRMPAIDRLTIHLRQENMRDGPHNRVRRPFQQIGEPHQKPTLAQSNGVVNVREGKEFDLQLRRRSPGTQLPVYLLEDFKQSLTHGELRLACSDLAGIVHSDDLLTGSFESVFFLCFAASTCSASSLRWSSTEPSTVSSALVKTNSYCLASSAETPAASLRASSLAWNSVSASMIIFSGFRMSFLRST